MRTHKKTAHAHDRAHKRNGHASSNALKPLKKAGKRTIYYISHKPGQTLGLAALATGLCVSLIYAKRLFK